MSWIRRLAVHRRPSDPLAQNRSWDFAPLRYGGGQPGSDPREQAESCRPMSLTRERQVMPASASA
jgi:hypothetical protein